MKFLFGGTSEGRQLVERYLAEGEQVVACVASEYGRSLLPEGIQCYAHPMALPEMLDVVRAHAPDALIDATHPFAVQVTANIRACAQALGIGYQRIERPMGDDRWHRHVRWACDARDAARMLAQEAGAVLLTTGANTVGTYAEVVAPCRLFVRVLPTCDALTKCAKAGIPQSHVVAMQGPFTGELNRALYAQLGVCHVVSKDSGDAGGLPEKVLPALDMGLNVIVIKRPEASHNLREEA